MICVDQMTKSFGTTTAVDRLSLSFDSGIIGLVGHNGAGKSTLLRLIAGIYHADEGSVSVDGVPATEPRAKKEVFFLSDDPYAPSVANMKGVLELYQGLFDLDENEYWRIVDIFGLPKNKNIGSFSKGMRRQAFIAVALSMKAKHLLLDEAFDGLDPMVVDSIKGEVLEAAAKGKTIVISSHNITALQNLVDRFVILSKGKLAKEEETEDIGTEFIKLQAAFLRPVSEEDIASLGLEVVSFRKVGSVTHMVILGGKEAADQIGKTFENAFLENVPLDTEEIVRLEMMLAKKRGGKSDD